MNFAESCVLHRYNDRMHAISRGSSHGQFQASNGTTPNLALDHTPWKQYFSPRSSTSDSTFFFGAICRCYFFIVWSAHMLVGITTCELNILNSRLVRSWTGMGFSSSYGSDTVLTLFPKKNQLSILPSHHPNLSIIIGYPKPRSHTRIPYHSNFHKS